MMVPSCTSRVAYRPRRGFRPPVVALLAVLVGCEVTVLEAAPPGNASGCDERLRGAWVAVGDDSPISSAVIDERCSASVSGEAVPSGAWIGLRVLDAPGHWIALASADASRVFPEHASGVPIPEGAWIPLSWSRSGDALLLGQPNARHVATLIAMDALDGRIACDRLPAQVGATDTLVNVLPADALTAHGLELEPMGFQLAFRRVGESVADLEKFQRKEAAKRGSQEVP